MDRDTAGRLTGRVRVGSPSSFPAGLNGYSGCRAHVRQALYMPALVAMRFNPDLKAKYDQLTAAGKVPKQAVTAIMRKLIVLANALLKKGRTWQENAA